MSSTFYFGYFLNFEYCYTHMLIFFVLLLVTEHIKVSGGLENGQMLGQ